MKTPICFCNGVIRSGSTWSFNVCRGLFQEFANQHGLSFGSAYLEQPSIEQFVARHWASAPGPTVIKCHMLGSLGISAIRSGRARAVCTFRDPRDCVASDVVFLGQGLDVSIKRVSASLEFLRLYQGTPHILLVKYEDMMNDRSGQIRRIASHLNIPADEVMIQQVDARTNIQSSKRICGELERRPTEKLMHIASHKVDPETHLHENHIGNAKIGRWKDEFSSQQAVWLTELFAPWLLQLGYETHESLRASLAMARFEPLTPSIASGQTQPQSSAFSVVNGLAQA